MLTTQQFDTVASEIIEVELDCLSLDDLIDFYWKERYCALELESDADLINLHEELVSKPV